jgi:hypothetical protein
MPSYVLTPERLAAYAELLDFRTQFVKAARQVLTAGGISAVGPGEGVQSIPRYYTTVDFQRGAATGRKAPVALGGRRYYEFSQYYGVLSVMNTVTVEEEEKADGAYLTEAHVRVLDGLTSKEDVLFMEHLEPFTAALLPNLDVQELLPIEPDERPIADRELNAAFRRWRVKFEIRYDRWPAT